MAIDRLLKVLQTLNDGRFHSGAELGRSLAITRSAIWKMTKQLHRYGIELESVVGRGYRLNQPFSFLDPNQIHSYLSPQAQQTIKTIDTLSSIDNPHSFLSSRIFESSKMPRICLCEHQNKANHNILSLAQDISLSSLWPFEPAQKPSNILPICCIALTNTLKQYGLDKHINVSKSGDIHYQNKRLATVSINQKQHNQSANYAIINFTIHANLTGKQFPLGDRDTSLLCIRKNIIDRNQLAARLINQLCYCLTTYLTAGSKLFSEEWQQLCQSATTT